MTDRPERGGDGRRPRAGRRRGRGQAHTVEAVVAGLLLLSAVSFALQVTAVTPLSASTSNQHIENQQRAVAEGLLGTTADDGSLKDALLYWDATSADPAFHCASNDEAYGSEPASPCAAPGDYANATPPNAFGDALGDAFGPGVAVNVFVDYENATGEVVTQRLVYRGQPTDNAVRATTTVVLFDDDELRDATGNETGTTVSGTSRFYAPPAPSASGANSAVYTVLRVEVVVWRI